MKWLYNLQIGRKLSLLVLVMAFFMLIIGFVGYQYNNKAEENLLNMYNDNLLPIDWLNDLRAQARANQANMLELIMTDDKQEKQAIMVDLSKRSKQANELLRQYKNSNLDSYEKNSMTKLDIQLSEYRDAREKTIALAMADKKAEAWQAYKITKEKLYLFNDTLVGLAKYNEEEARNTNTSNLVNGLWAKRIIIFTIVLAVLLASLLGMFLGRIISNPLKVMVENFVSLSQGDLTMEQLKMHSSQDEIGQLAAAFNRVVLNLRSLVEQIAVSSHEVEESSQELNSGIDESTHASEQVANTLQDIVIAAEDASRESNSISSTSIQISAGVEEVAANAQSVTDNAKQAAQAARLGNEDVASCVQQMNFISSTVGSSAQAVKLLGDRSEQIGKIVESITAIADQTNLLALNAAIEAARAGEQGKGFAVVAEEVRKLAEESSRAAKEIAQLIKSIQKETINAVSSMQEGTSEVEKGLQVVNRLGNSFAEIMQSVEDVSSQVESISAAMEEMAAGTNSLVESVNIVDEKLKKSQTATQEIAAAAQEQSASLGEISSAADFLASLAQKLQTVVGKFKL